MLQLHTLTALADALGPMTEADLDNLAAAALRRRELQAEDGIARVLWALRTFPSGRLLFLLRRTEEPRPCGRAFDITQTVETLTTRPAPSWDGGAA